jgi:hypothetical protein
MKPHVEELGTTKGGVSRAFIWQDCDDGVAEPALLWADYPSSRMVELRQGQATILINYETINELCRMFRRAGKQGEKE